MTMPTMIRIEVTPELEAQLSRVMEMGDYASPDEAIRALVGHAAAPRPGDLAWEDAVGWANRFPEDPEARFKTEDDLWS